MFILFSNAFMPKHVSHIIWIVILDLKINKVTRVSITLVFICSKFSWYFTIFVCTSTAPVISIFKQFYSLIVILLAIILLLELCRELLLTNMFCFFVFFNFIQPVDLFNLASDLNYEIQISEWFLFYTCCSIFVWSFLFLLLFSHSFRLKFLFFQQFFILFLFTTISLLIFFRISVFFFFVLIVVCICMHKM